MIPNSSQKRLFSPNRKMSYKFKMSSLSPHLQAKINQSKENSIFKIDRDDSFSLYFDQSPDYYLTSNNWMINRDSTWMYNVCNGLYYNVKSEILYYYDPINKLLVPHDPNYNNTSVDYNQSSSYYTINKLGTTSQSKHSLEFYSFDLLDNSKLSHSIDVDPTHDDYFLIDFDKDIIIHTAALTSCLIGKIEREDRHVTKERIQIHFLGDTSSCCYYSSIFDGHGGSLCAEYCVNNLSANIITSFTDIHTKNQKDYFKNISCLSPLYDDDFSYSNGVKALCYSLYKAFQITDQNYIRIARDNGLVDGCTALVALMYGPDEDGSMKLLTAHVGDSRAVLCRSGEALRITEDHKPQKDTEKARIERAGGKVAYIKGVWRVVVNVGNKVFGLSTARSIGDIHMKTPNPLISCIPDLNILPLDFFNDNFLIMGSDGIWDVLTDQEACDIVKEYLEEKSSQKAAEALVAIAQTRGSFDDKTATVIFFAW